MTSNPGELENVPQAFEATPQITLSSRLQSPGTDGSCGPTPLSGGREEAAVEEVNANPQYPTWLTEHLNAHRHFIENLDPFPFNQPSDIRPFLSLHQNDYLRLANHPEVIEARAEANSHIRIESFSSSVFGGASKEHERFIALMRESMQAGDVIPTTAGWTANVGLIEGIVPPDRAVYIDVEAHSSLGDGIRLSRGRKVVVRHNDPDHLEKRVRIHGPGVVCIDALYSTDGVIPDLARYVKICEEYGCALILDEAHSFGMFGKNGGGIAVEQGLAHRVHFRTVSLSKALGGHGGIVAGNAEMIRSLCTCMRPLLFSSATSAVLAAGHHKALEILIREPWRAKHCLAMAALLRSELHKRNILTANSASQIVSIYFRDERACDFYQQLRELGILTSVFVFPAVPKGISLSRFSVYAELTQQDIHYIVECVVKVLDKMNLLGVKN